MSELPSTVDAPAAVPLGEQVILRLSGSPENVRTARLVAVATARRTGMPEACIDEVRLCVGEAVTWAVQRSTSATIELVIDSGEGAAFRAVVRWLPPVPASPPSDTTDNLSLALLEGLADSVHVDDYGVTMVWDADSWT